MDRCKAATVTKHIKAAAAAVGRTPPKQQQQQESANTAEQQQQQQAAAAVPAAGSGGGEARKTPGYNVAYVGNIAFEAGPDDLKQIFAECGVTKVCVTMMLYLA